jgi:hypothetical protein
MNDMDEPAFKHFLGSLYRHSARSPFMHTVLTIPFLGAIPYFYLYGFSNRWITAGLALWLVAGRISKMIKVPIYKTVAALESGDVARLSGERQRLNAGNMLQAILNFVAAAFMTVAFIRR